MRTRIRSLAGEIELPPELFRESRAREFVDIMVERGGMEREQAWRYAAEILVLTAGELAERLGSELGGRLARILELRRLARQKYEAVLEQFARGRGGPGAPLPPDLQPQAFRRLFIEMAAEIRGLEELRVRDYVTAHPPAGVPFEVPRNPRPTPEHVEARLRGRGHEDLLDWFEDVPAGAQRERYARELGGLSDRELDGLQEIAALPEDRVSLIGSLDDILSMDRQLRGDLLEAVAEVAPHAAATLHDVLHGILQRFRRGETTMQPGFQGSLGQLHAARHLVRAGATEIVFEVRTPGRHVDIRATIGGREVHVEVKTPVAGEAFITPGELMIDLVRYAPDGYQGLRYLYPENVDVGGVAARMRNYFNEGEVQRGLARLGIDRGAAERAFDAWIAAGGVGQYRFSP